jgi:F-type H+-transporting ATPase subunit delta
MGRFRALPYAKALLMVIQRDGPQRLEEVAVELEAVAAALVAVPEFERVLVAPTVAAEKKTAILDTVLDALEMGQPTRRFLQVVQQHYRMQHLPDIAVAFRELVDRTLGRTRAKVETATGLAEVERGLLVEVVSAIEDAEVVAEFSEKPELLGGFRLQVGSRVFDGSLAGELKRLSKEIQVEQG